jgi:hypothetical protein
MLFYLFLFLVKVNGEKMLEPMQDIPPLKIPVQNGTGLIQTILSDPKKFVENAVNLDPVAVETIVAMLEELRTTSEHAEANLIAQLAARSEEAVITGNAVADAGAAVTAAQGQLTDREAELAAAEGAHDDKLGEKDAAQKEHDDGVPILQNEQDVINQVIEMLRAVKSGGEWITVAEESQGDTGSDNSDWQTLGWLNLPSFTSDGDYLVRMEWPNNFMEFTVPAGSDIFKNSGDTTITGVTTSVTNPGYGSDAIFCHACMKNGGDKPGDTCWGVLPAGEGNRQCGCNSGGWTGNGVYYGGYAQPTRCGGWGGGFAGPKTNGQQKGGIHSPGLVLKIKSL